MVRPQPVHDLSIQPDRSAQARSGSRPDVALGDLLVAGGERVGMLGQDERAIVGRTIPGRIMRALASTEDLTQDEHLPDAQIPGHARVVLFGDFLEPPDLVGRWLERHVAEGVKGVLVQVVDPAEETFPYVGRMLIEGMEHDGSRLVENANSLGARYRTIWQAHRASLSDQARRQGWGPSGAPYRPARHHGTDALWQALALPYARSA